MHKLWRKIAILSVLGVYMWAVVPAYALDFIRPFVPNYQQVGKGVFKFAIFKVYNAILYAPNGIWDKQKPFALQLVYTINIKSTKITYHTITELQKQGFNDQQKLDKWEQQLNAIYPDLSAGMSLTGVYTGTGETLFFKNDTPIGKIDDAEFSDLFFDIWLGEKTSAPKVRNSLLGIR